MTILEQLGIEYEEKDVIYYPLLSVNQEHSTLLSVGKYGDMWVHFMEEESPDRYRNLIRFGRLGELAKEVNEQAYDLLESIEKRYLQKHMKPETDDFMKRVNQRNQARMTAEEIVLKEVVFICR